MPNVEQAEIARVYELCKLQAATEGAFDERLLAQWFEASWDLCAQMIGLIWPPPPPIKEPLCIDDCGGFSLSYRPTSEVKIYDGYRLVATLPPSLKVDRRCMPALCCLCKPYAEYSIGHQFCELPPRFVQAVMRTFTYLVENRGDEEQDPQILKRSGALAFLGPDLTYVL